MSETATPLLKQLASAVLFEGLPETTLKAVLLRCSRRRLASDTVLFHQDDAGAALFVILSGRVVVERIGLNGEKMFVAERGPGQHVGEMSLIDDAVRMATVSTIEETDFLVLRQADFAALLHEEPTVALQIIRSLTQRLREMSDRAFLRENLDVTGRMAALLLERVRSETLTGDGPHRFAGWPDRAIAERIGVARESVARRWERLSGSGAAKRSGRDVIVLSVRKLTKLAGAGV